jgi:N-acetylneuraminic acid mutarotase
MADFLLFYSKIKHFLNTFSNHSEGGLLARPARTLVRLTAIAVIAIVLLSLSVAMAASSGPASGGNILTITGTGLGNGSDITNVTLCGVPAAIQGQTVDSVTVVTGAADDGGTGDILVFSASVGMTTFTNGYTYNPPGAIFGPFMGWSSISNLPISLTYAAAASVNGKLYSLGGYQFIPGGKSTNVSSVYVYDPAQPAQGWMTASNLPQPTIEFLAATTVNGKIYAIGEWDGHLYSSTAVYVYDPAQPSLGWLSVSNLPVTLGSLAVANANGKIYTIGYTDPSLVPAAYVYDTVQPSLGWLSMSKLPKYYTGLAAASANGKIYAFGASGDTSSLQSSVYVYDPSQPGQGWLSVSNLPTASMFEAATSVNGKICLMEGYYEDKYTVRHQPLVYTYDPSQPALGWLSMSNLPQPICYFAGCSASGNIYAAGGTVSTNTSPAFKGSFASGVVPSSGPLAGGNSITINGNNLGNGDVTNVTLCGIPATIVADYSPTQIVVTAGATITPTTGDVVVNSTSYGVTVASNAFTYFQLPKLLTASDGTSLQLSWPTNCLGWMLEAQTNGLGNNWFPVTGSTTNNQFLILINPANSSVFYRLKQ